MFNLLTTFYLRAEDTKTRVDGWMDERSGRVKTALSVQNSVLHPGYIHGAVIEQSMFSTRYGLRDRTLNAQTKCEHHRNRDRSSANEQRRSSPMLFGE